MPRTQLPSLVFIATCRTFLTSTYALTPSNPNPAQHKHTPRNRENSVRVRRAVCCPGWNSTVLHIASSSIPAAFVWHCKMNTFVSL